MSLSIKEARRVYMWEWTGSFFVGVDVYTYITTAKNVCYHSHPLLISRPLLHGLFDAGEFELLLVSTQLSKNSVYVSALHCVCVKAWGPETTHSAEPADTVRVSHT